MLIRVCYIQNTMNKLFEVLLKPFSTSPTNVITTRIADDTKIITTRQEGYTDIPLMAEDERKNTTNLFVKPGTTLTVKRAVSGEYTDNGTFRYTKGRITHYLVEGLFTNQNGVDNHTTLCIPKKTIEQGFKIKQ